MIKLIEIEPSGDPSFPIVFMKNDPALANESVIGKHDVKQDQNLMTGCALVNIDVLEEKWLTDRRKVDTQFLLELTRDGTPGSFAKFDAAPERTDAFDPTCVVMDFRGQQSALAPMEAQCLDAYSLLWSPYAHGVVVG